MNVSNRPSAPLAKPVMLNAAVGPVILKKEKAVSAMSLLTPLTSAKAVPSLKLTEPLTSSVALGNVPLLSLMPIS